MECCKDESPVALAHQQIFPIEKKLRPVLVTSEKNNAVLANGKPQTREVISRYKSGITSTPRSLSPKAIHTPSMSRTIVTQRAQSTERRRPSTPSSPPSRCSAPSSPSSRPSPPSTPLLKCSRPSSSSSSSSRPSTPLSSPSSRSTTPVHNTMVVERLNASRRSLAGRAPDALWPSIRSLSASFQSESSPVLSSRSDKLVRNPSPDRTLKSSQSETYERKKTPLRGRNTPDQSENSTPVENSRARAIDQLRWPAMIGGKGSSNLLSTKSMDLTDKISKAPFLSTSGRGLSPTRGMSLTEVVSRGLRNSSSEVALSVSSKGSEKASHLVGLSRNASSLQLERAPTSIRPRRSPSPVPGFVRPSSPNKASATLFSISRGMLSPPRTRPSTPCSPSSNASMRVGISSSILNYVADMQKGKRSPSHIEDAHQLRILNNRDLQWRFVNASADAAISTQKLIAEDMLYNVWNYTSELRDSIILKRIDVQSLRQEMKLKLILEEQIAYVKDWSALEAEYSCTLSGMIEALKASTLRLPVTGRARADVHPVKYAISSAVDVMQAMGSSICFLLSRVEAIKPLVSELSDVAATESIMLAECRELLASTAAMQVQECSLRTHLIQLKQDARVE